MRPDRPRAAALALAIIMALLPVGVPVPATRGAATGYAWAWGRNDYGQLGNGSTTDSSTPVLASGLTGVTAIAAGATFSLALKADGTVWEWGYNLEEYTDYGSTPVAVSGLAGVTAIAAGWAFSLAIKNDGTVWAWGRNYWGQLGDGTTNDSNTPVAVSGLTGVTAIAAGDIHSLALKNDGTVWAWGHNGLGQLGDGTTTNRSTPVAVSGLTGVSTVDGGQLYSLALLSDATVRAWGYNAYGQLGDGTTTNRSSTVAVSGLTGVTAIDAGAYHSLTLNDGTTAPTGSITIAGGAAYTKAADVSLDLAASDIIGTVSEMRLSEDPGLAGSSWEPYAATTTFTLSGSDGTKTVYARFRDADGNVSDIVSDSIVLDRVAPDGTLTINGGALTTTDRAINVAVAATDDASGIGAYRLSNDGATWSDWASGSASVATSWTLDPGDGTKIVYAQVRDGAGNVSLPASDAIDLDTSVPSDDYLVSINGGAVYTNSPDVVLTLAAKPGTTEMKLSNDGGFSGAAWEPYASRRAWTTNSYGSTVVTTTVYAKFRDGNGAVVALTAADDIVLDPNAPTPGGGSAAPATASADAPAPYASTTVTLDTRASDDRSGVRAMMVSNSSSFSGAAWQPYATSRPWPISAAAATTVYLRFRDGAGNVSAASSRVLAAPATPTVPTQLAPVHGLATTTRQPTFRWRGVNGATSYQLQVSADPAFGSVALSATTSVASFTRSTPFGRSLTLYWRVRVAGGAWSPAWRFSTPQADPPGLIAPAAGSTTALLPPTLDWAAVAGADLYQVQLAVDPYFTAAVRSRTTSATAATFVPLAREARFFWRVRARVGGVWGAWSNARAFTTPFLSRPTLRRPAAGATLTRPVTLDWFDVNGAATYRVHVCADAACADIVRSFSATGSILRFLATIPDGDYWWRVRAVAASGRTSAWSVLRSFTL